MKTERNVLRHRISAQTRFCGAILALSLSGAVVLSGVFCAFGETSGGSNPVEWPQYMNDAGHTGYYDGFGPMDNHTSFAKTIDDGNSPTSAVVDSSNIYLGVDGGSKANTKIIAIDKKSLQQKWKYEFTGDNNMAFWFAVQDPILYKDTIIAAVLHIRFYPPGNPTIIQPTQKTQVVALDKETGEIRWSHDYMFATFAPFTLDGDTLYFASNEYVLINRFEMYKTYAYAMDAKTGDVLWKGELPAITGMIQPSVSKENVLFALTDGTVAALKKQGGTPSRFGLTPPTPISAWIAALGEGTYRHAAVWDERAIVVTGAGNITCLDAKTGKIEWTWKRESGTMLAETGAMADGNFVTVGRDGVLRIFNTTTGKIISSVAANATMPGKPDVVFTSNPIITKNGIYVCGEINKNNTIFCFDREMGFVWMNRTAGFAWVAGALSDGKLYLSTGPCMLYVFDGAGGARSGAGASGQQGGAFRFIEQNWQALLIASVLICAGAAIGYYAVRSRRRRATLETGARKRGKRARKI